MAIDSAHSEPLFGQSCSHTGHKSVVVLLSDSRLTSLCIWFMNTRERLISSNKICPLATKKQICIKTLMSWLFGVC